MSTVVLWIWLSTGPVWAQGTYTPQKCLDEARAMIQSGEVVIAQCIETRGA